MNSGETNTAMASALECLDDFTEKFAADEVEVSDTLPPGFMC